MCLCNTCLYLVQDDKAVHHHAAVSRLLIENANQVSKDYKLYLVQEYCDASLHAVLGK
jgi:hypothetical protein